MSTTIDRPARPTTRDVLRTMLKHAQTSGRSDVLALEARPDAVAGLHRSGPRPYRVLMYGGGVLEGRGLRDHNLGLPGRVADLLAGRSGRGVDLDVVAVADPTGAPALRALRGLRLPRYDAVIVLLGERSADSRASEATWEARFAELAQVLLDEVDEIAPIALWDSAHVSGPLGLGWSSRAAAERATRLAAVTEQMCALTSRIHYRELRVPVRRPEFASRFAPATYEEWADDIVSPLYLRMVELRGRISSRSPKAFRDRPDDERLRQRALDSMRIEPGTDALLEAIVRSARLMFGVEEAAINIVDGPVVWQKATTAPASRRFPREGMICSQVVHRDGLTLINDTQRDPQLAGIPYFEGPDAIRFYAGHPIRTWDGYGIGSLCIVGREPRAMRPTELRPLRDFANRIEQELWAAALRPRR